MKRKITLTGIWPYELFWNPRSLVSRTSEQQHNSLLYHSYQPVVVFFFVHASQPVLWFSLAVSLSVVSSVCAWLRSRNCHLILYHVALKVIHTAIWRISTTSPPSYIIYILLGLFLSWPSNINHVSDFLYVVNLWTKTTTINSFTVSFLFHYGLQSELWVSTRRQILICNTYSFQMHRQPVWCAAQVQIQCP